MSKSWREALAQAVTFSLGRPGDGDGLGAHDALLAILARVDQAAARADIGALIRETLDAKPPHAAENFFPAVYSALQAIPEPRAAAILAEAAGRHAFRYDKYAPARGELAEFMDARMNAVLVKHLLAALNSVLAAGEITQEKCLSITDRILADGGTRTNPVYVTALERSIRLVRRQQPDKPLVYLSIGCGSGREDVGSVTTLKQRLPGLDLLVAGFDPFQRDAEKNLIRSALQGTLINRELAPGETFASLAREATGRADASILATERYALHHMGRSPACFLTEIEGATLVSVEEPVTALQRESLAHRLATIGYDILANHALEQRFGGSWVSEARKDPALFGVLYRRLEDLEAQRTAGVILEKVESVYPATYVITYPGAERR